MDGWIGKEKKYRKTPERESGTEKHPEMVIMYSEYNDMAVEPQSMPIVEDYKKLLGTTKDRIGRKKGEGERDNEAVIAEEMNTGRTNMKNPNKAPKEVKLVVISRSTNPDHHNQTVIRQTS